MNARLSSLACANMEDEESRLIDLAVEVLEPGNLLLGAQVVPPVPDVVDLEELRMVAAKIKEMEESLRSGSIISPSPLSFSRLFQLCHAIQHHVCTCIFLFEIEESNSEFHRLKSQRRNEKNSAAYLVHEQYGGTGKWRQVGELDSDICCGVVMLADFLKHQRDRMLRLYFAQVATATDTEAPNPDQQPEGSSSKRQKMQEKADLSVLNPSLCSQSLTAESEEGKLEAKVPIGLETREHCLLGVLQALIKMQRMRSYGPPTRQEIKHYLETRKCITSALACIQGKADVCAELAEAERKYLDSAQFRRDRCPPLKKGFTCIDKSCIPLGNKVVWSLDAVPQVLSLIRECSSRLKDALGAYEPQEKDEIRASGACVEDLVFARFQDENGYNVSMLMPDNGEEGVENSSHGGVNREKCLETILSIFKTLPPCTRTEPLTAIEFRLLVKIEEHARSSLLMLASGGSGTYGMQGEFGQGSSSLASKDVGGDDSSHVSGESREHDLQKIIVLIEAIESSHLGAPLTPAEMKCYHQIRFSSSNYKSNACRVRESNSDSHLPDMGMARLFIEYLTARELEFLHSLEKEYGTWVMLLVPEFPDDIEADSALDWFADRIDNFYEDEDSKDRPILPAGEDLISKIRCINHCLAILYETEEIGNLTGLIELTAYMECIVGKKEWLNVVEEVYRFIQSSRLLRAAAQD